MTFDEYQAKSDVFRLPSYIPEAAVFGLLSESGEVAGVFQKMIRGDFPPAEAYPRLFKELGDVMWHVAAIANDNNWKMEDICKENLEKLESRRLRNKIMGSGDER